MKHDESVDVRLLNRSSLITVLPGEVIINKKSMAIKPIGLRSWGRIDFLINHCGYILSYDDRAVINAPKQDAPKHKNKNNKEERKVKKMRNDRKN